ncbi:hypothetical protein PR048_011232 [Dryococelus australis]|uniref:Uncharacterized protein n=1 Tax=Dryococelus australis TaxID=614101 RepID=A0ABQ9HLR4_9NEOP|nr:hypothetical protein PR048_011232 [Dryococelus australis]
MLTMLWTCVIQHHKAKTKRKKWDVNIHPITFNVGDEVLVATHHLSSLINKQIHKFFKLFEGPYCIEHDVGHNVYKLNNANWHIFLLRPWKVRAT